MNPIDKLRKEFPWPKERPDYEFDDTGAFTDYNRRVLKDNIMAVKPKVVLEIGAFMGLSTRWLAEEVETVITIDHFKGSREHIAGIKKDKLDGLKERFQANCWELRDRITVVEMHSPIGIQAVKDFKVPVDLMYLDGSHELLDVLADLRAIKRCFPNAKLTGDDFNLPGVRQALKQMNIRVQNIGGAWWEL